MSRWKMNPTGSPHPRYRRGSATLRLVALTTILSACSTAPPPQREAAGDPELATWVSSARLAFDEGSLQKAVELYSRALRRAHAMDDAQAIADSAYNLSTCLLLSGEPQLALDRTREAALEFQRLGMESHALQVLEARCLQALGQPAPAARALKRVLESKTADAAVQAQAHLLRASLAIDARDAQRAREGIGAAKQLLEGHDEPDLEALGAGLEGKRLLLTGQPLEAALRFDQQSEDLRRLGRYGDMGHALEDAGDAYTVGGKPATAADRLYRSARSFAAQDALFAARRVAKKLETIVASQPTLGQAWEVRADEILARLPEPSGP